MSEIDNRPLTVAREEGEAQEAARQRPIEHAVKTELTSNVHEFAKITGKMVLRGASEAGLSEEELAPMRGRMAKWVNIVVLYAKDIREAKRIEDTATRNQVLADMTASRDEAFRELFG